MTTLIRLAPGGVVGPSVAATSVRLCESSPSPGRSGAVHGSPQNRSSPADRTGVESVATRGPGKARRMKRVLVTGAGGFIGSHLVGRLASSGIHVCGVDVKEPEFAPSRAQEFRLLDLRDRDACAEALQGGFDEVYNLAADMGGMGFIHSAECEIMRNNALINLNMIDAAAEARVSRYFFSSSVCIYRDMVVGEPELDEAGAYPALPDNEYGWEKLYAER